MDTPSPSRKPLVSAYCATYAANPVLLQHVIGCFVMQDYDGPKRLTIFNDTPGTYYHCTVPDVHVVNAPSRIWPLGKKFNQTVLLALGGAPEDTILCPWESDDLWLPHAMRYGVEHQDPIRRMFHTRQFFITTSDGWRCTENMAHCALFCHRSAFKGYDDNAGRTADVSLWRNCNIVSQTIPWSDAYYVYRFADSGCYHVSCLEDGKEPPTHWHNLGDVDLQPVFLGRWIDEAKNAVTLLETQGVRA